MLQRYADANTLCVFTHRVRLANQSWLLTRSRVKIRGDSTIAEIEVIRAATLPER